MSQNSFLNAFLNLRGTKPALESAQDPGAAFDNLLEQYSRQWISLEKKLEEYETEYAKIVEEEAQTLALQKSLRDTLIQIQQATLLAEAACANLRQDIQTKDIKVDHLNQLVAARREAFARSERELADVRESFKTECVQLLQDIQSQCKEILRNNHFHASTEM